MENNIVIRNQFTPTDNVITPLGDEYHYSVEWEIPKAYIDEKTGEIVQAHGDPKPHLVKAYNIQDKIQAALPATDMFTIVQRAMAEPGCFMLKAEQCGDVEDLPLNDYNAYYSGLARQEDLLEAASRAFDKLTDEEKAVIGTKADLYNAVLNNNVDQVIQRFLNSKKKEDNVNA